MSWRWISIAALLGALVIGYGTLTRRDSQSDVDAVPPQPGYFLVDAVISQTLEDGTPGVKLSARRVEQSLDESGIRLEQVHADYLKADKRWLLTANSGFVPPNSRILRLTGDVDLRPADQAQRAFLKTDEIEIDTVKNLAYNTRGPVRVQLRSSRFTAKALRADLNTETIELENVSGRFVPE